MVVELGSCASLAVKVLLVPGMRGVVVSLYLVSVLSGQLFTSQSYSRDDLSGFSKHAVNIYGYYD